MARAAFRAYMGAHPPVHVNSLTAITRSTYLLRVVRQAAHREERTQSAPHISADQRGAYTWIVRACAYCGTRSNCAPL